MSENVERKNWMGLLARAPAAMLHEGLGKLGALPAFAWLRAPEFGGVMVRGRAGGTGGAFNMGEMTITRCSLKLLDGGTVGHAYIQGRDKEKAQAAALVDALMQTGMAAEVEAQVLAPIRTHLDTQRRERAAKAAATKVDFFTLVRGED